jgi:hypothetical protein
MPLRERAVLEIDIVDDSGAERTCVFELREDLEVTTSTTKTYLIGNRGQYLREAVDLGSDVLGIDLPEADNRRGYHVDGGAGVETITIEATGGDRGLQWGDGSTDPNDPADVSQYDATGCDPGAQRDILDWIVSQAKTDSASPARLFHGEWSDGTHAGDAGAFGKPRAVAIREATLPNPPDESSAFNATIEMIWTDVFPSASVDDAQQAIDELLNEVPE